MNYIKKLQQEKLSYYRAYVRAQREINGFLCFLNSPKFQGVDLDGSRKDWISTKDVQNKLRNIQNIIHEEVFNSTQK